MKFKDGIERTAYIDGELKKVTGLLDGVAQETGAVFVALRVLAAEDLVKVAKRTIKALNETTDFVERRVDLARVHYAEEDASEEQDRVEDARQEAKAKDTDGPRVCVYLQKGDEQRGWLHTFTITADGADMKVAFTLTTNVFETKILQLNVNTRPVLNWFYRNGYVVRVCQKVDGCAWIGPGAEKTGGGEA